MIQPVIIQPNYMNAMTQGLGARLAYMAESKKGGGNIMLRGIGHGEPSRPKKAFLDRKAEEAARAKENKERNALYRKRQAEEDKIREQEEAAAQKNEATRQKNFMEQLKSYAPAVTQDNYEDYLAFARENGIELTGAATPEQVRQMSSPVFKKYMSNFFGGEKAKSKRSYRAQLEEEALKAWADGAELNKQQKKIISKIYPTTDKKKLTPNQRLELDKKLAETEVLLTNPEHEKDRLSIPLIRFFNTYSKTPYMYGYLETGHEVEPLESKNPFSSRFWGVDVEDEGITRIDLPVINGKQITAEDITYTAEKTGKSVKQILADLGVYNAD